METDKKTAYKAMSKMLDDKLQLDTDNQAYSVSVLPSDKGWHNLNDIHLTFCGNCTIIYSDIHDDYVGELRHIALMG